MNSSIAKSLHVDLISHLSKKLLEKVGYRMVPISLMKTTGSKNSSPRGRGCPFGSHHSSRRAKSCLCAKRNYPEPEYLPQELILLCA